jgi:hypothetical protein
VDHFNATSDTEFDVPARVAMMMKRRQTTKTTINSVFGKNWFFLLLLLSNIMGTTGYKEIKIKRSELPNSIL